jgi:hypothetical protein
LVDFIDKTSEQDGTPINRQNMMAIQGFVANDMIIEGENVIETNSKGETLTITKNADGSITETFVGDKIITRTTKVGVGSIEVTIE